MTEADLEHIRVSECSEGHGYWLSAEELRQAKDRAYRDIRWIDDDLFGAAVNRRAGRRKCPVCGEGMNREEYPHSKVTIDVCVADHGVWLDGGEFEKIVGSLYELTHELTAREYRHETAVQLKEVFTGPESRLSEFEDFLAVYRLLKLRLAVEHPRAAALSQALEQAGL